MPRYAKMHAGITYKISGAKKRWWIFAFSLLVFLTPTLKAAESTIYISVESHNGKFEDAEYRLNSYRIRFSEDLLFINNKKTVSIFGSQLIELSVENSKLTLILDGLKFNLRSVN